MTANVMEIGLLSVEELHRRVLSIRRSQSILNWELAACLRALEKAGAFTSVTCSSIEMYARTQLNMNPQKASELLRAARRLETAPQMSVAFRRGELSWSKVRELTRHVTAENDEDLTRWALAHTADEIQRSMVMSPRRWQQRTNAADRQSATAVESSATTALDLMPPAGSSPDVDSQNTAATQCGTAYGDPIATLDNVGTLVCDGTVTYCATEIHDLSVEASGVIKAHPTDSEAPQDAATWASSETGPVMDDQDAASEPSVGATIDRSTNGAGEDSMPESLKKKRLIGFIVYIEPGDYAMFEQAKAKVHARLGKRVPMAVVMRELCQRYLTTGSSQSNLKHQVHVHVDGDSGSAWYETDRGPLPADSPKSAVVSRPQKRRVATEGAAANPTSASQDADATSEGMEPQSALPRGVSHSGDVPAISESIERSRIPVPQATEDLSTGKPTAQANETAYRSTVQQPRSGRRIPTTLLRDVVIRAKGRCETIGCGRTTGLQVHHVDAFCEVQRHQLEQLRLLCNDCHGATHIDDFATRQTWRYARERRNDGAPRTRRSRVGHPPDNATRSHAVRGVNERLE